MPFPSEKELKRVRKKLEKAEPSLGLPDDATELEVLKYELCQKFVAHIVLNKLTQLQLANKLEIDPARMNDIVKYRIKHFTLDRLYELTKRLDPNLKLCIA
jgi:predicted XRE-type DNA-binding protein